MGYLERRVSFLLHRLEEGRLVLSRDLLRTTHGRSLAEDLSRVKRLPDGTVDVSTCSAHVRSFARAIHVHHRATTIREAEEGESDQAFVSTETVSAAMREYFELLESFFVATTGATPTRFAVNQQAFVDRLRRDAKRIAGTAEKAFAEYVPRIGRFHTKHTELLLGSSRALGGLRCVLGGSSRFPEAAFDGLRKFALYADTILVPDPLLPWMEVERDEEQFPRVSLLEQCYNLLRLKPLVFADLPYPAVVVFPSWEKGLEEWDEETKDGISELVLAFFSHYLDATFEDESEVVDYVAGSGRDTFREAVSRSSLFLPPGAEEAPLFDEGAQRYREWLGTSRSPTWLAHAEDLSDEMLVLNGILERLVPQFHVRDNARTLRAQPLFWLPVHFHYFRLTAQATNDGLRQGGLLKPETMASMRALLTPGLAWLGNIPIEHLARLREENRNEDFRRRLNRYVDDLSTADLDRIDEVAAEVVRGIASLLVEHETRARQIAEEYNRRHRSTLGLGILTLGVMLYPEASGYAGALPALAPLGKYVIDLINRASERRVVAQSLTGVLSAAKQRAEG